VQPVWDRRVYEFARNPAANVVSESSEPFRHGCLRIAGDLLVDKILGQGRIECPAGAGDEQGFVVIAAESLA